MDTTDFGNYLKQQRELRGMSREQVAAVTKMPLGLMAALEAGDFRKLPSRVFVINFVRAYAGVIGIEADDAVLRYEEACRVSVSGPEEDPVLSRKAAPQRSRVPAARLFVAVLFLVLLGLAAGFFLWHRAGHPLRF